MESGVFPGVRNQGHRKGGGRGIHDGQARPIDGNGPFGHGDVVRILRVVNGDFPATVQIFYLGTVPVVSTCPCTTWPSNRAPETVQRSMFTRRPMVQDPNVVFSKVSAMAVTR